MHVASINSRFLDACRRRSTDVRPVWFMRQAGRYLKSYRDVRAKHSILEICKKPELAAEVTIQPVEILDVDAAIIFADLLLPVEPMGLRLEFVAGEGPSIDNPVTEPARHRRPVDRPHGRSGVRRRIDSTGDAGARRTCAGGGIRGRAVYAGQLHD